jgi:hypothetical protein
LALAHNEINRAKHPIQINYIALQPFPLLAALYTKTLRFKPNKNISIAILILKPYNTV